MIMKNFLFCLFLILGANIAAAESIITVNVNNSTDAVWVMEKFIPLTNSEFNEWDNMINTGQNFSRYRNIPEYEDLFKTFQNFSLNFSNRSTEVEMFNITYDSKKTLSDGQGIIRYTFVWKNFAYKDSKNISVGDAFPGGVIQLSPENQLRIKIPEGYDVVNATPAWDKKNGNLLVWDGTLSTNFSDGQPFIVLSPANITNLTAPVDESRGWNWLIIEGVILFIVIIAFVAFYRFWKKKRLEKVSTRKIEFYEDMLTEVPGEMLNEISEIPEFWKKMVQSVQKEHGTESVEKLEKAAKEQRLINMGLDPSIALSDLEDLDDEEMIRQFLLRKDGGQAYQSDIVKYSGLSKSKISMVLSKMKGDGMIIKIRKGKENLIRLAKPPDNEGGS
jgi:DNA-binding transcriptional ArsR family regulator